MVVGVDDARGDDVLQLLLDGAAQVARAVGERVGLVRQIRGNGIVIGEDEALLLQAGRQLVEHDAGDGYEVLLVEAIEADDLVHAVDELGTQELAERLHRALAVLLADAAAEADAALLAVAAGVGGHDDDGVFKVDLAAVRVGHLAVVENLQQDVQHIRVRLLDLVEENNGVGLAANFFGQLTGLVIADVARRGADETRDGVLLHKLRHIETNERVGRIEKVGGKLLDQLRLAHAGGADENEAHGLVLRADAHAPAADGRGDRVHGLVLPDDVLFQAVGQLAQALELGLADAAGGNFRPQLDHAGEIVHRQLGIALRAETVQLALRLELEAPELGKALEVGILGLRLEQLALLGVIVQLAAQLHAAVDVLVVQVHIRARLVDQVDGLIRQEAVGDVALGEHDGLAQDTVGNFHAVEGLVVVGDALENFERILHARLVDRDGLEAALKRGVLLDVLAVLVEGRRADDLNFAAREGGLQNIGGVHAALGVARANDVMHLVDDENDVAELANFLNKTLHAALELAAELRAGDERGEVKEIDLLAAELEGHLARGDALGKALGNGRLADARLADEAGVVLLAAVENLNDALDLLVAADHRVELAVAGALGEVDAIAVKKFMLGGLVVLLAALGAARAVRRAVRRRGRVAVLPSEKAAEEREGRGLAVLLVVAVGRVDALKVFGAAESTHHLVGDVVKVLVGDAHALHHLVHLR